MADTLQVTIIEVSNVLLESRSKGNGSFFISMEIGDSTQSTSHKSTPVRAVFVEKFLFDLDTLQPDPNQLLLTLHQVLDESRSLELGTAIVTIKPGSHDVAVKRSDGTIMCKAQIHLGSPGAVPEPTGYTVHAKPHKLASKEFLGVYALVALLLLAWFGGLLRQRSIESPLPLGAVKFPPGSVLRTNEFIAGCVGLSRATCQPMYLHMRPDGNLVFCKGSSPSEYKGLVWQTHTQWFLHSDDYSAEMLQDGQILVRKGHKKIWRNPIAKYEQFRGTLTV